VKRWAVAGALIGIVAALVAFAPAAWLAAALAGATDGRLLLADARGSVWSGSAVPVLTGGPGSRDASRLPGRLHWTLAADGSALLLAARHACCIDGTLRLRLRPGWQRLRVELLAPPGGAPLGHWPAAWLAGLGTPWNTLQPSGTLQVASPGLMLESVQGRWRFDGRLELLLQGMASRVSTLDTLGDYRLVLAGEADGPATLRLDTQRGALILSGSGQWAAGTPLRFQGEARAAPGAEAVLSNLLNIIGRRQGERSLITIG